MSAAEIPVLSLPRTAGGMYRTRGPVGHTEFEADIYRAAGGGWTVRTWTCGRFLGEPNTFPTLNDARAYAALVFRTVETGAAR